MVERLIIHLGLHKTGTTAVQRYLESYSADLLERGASYVSIGRMREQVTLLFYDTDDEKRYATRRLFEEFTTPALVLSDENISGGVDDIRAGGFYPAARRKLTGFLEGVSDLDVHVVLALRNPVELVPALYCEYLRLHEFMAFDTYVAKLDLSSLSVWDTFGWIRSLQGNVTPHVIPYEARFGGGVPRVATTILEAAIGTADGFDLKTFGENKVRTSFTADEVELASLIASKASGKVARFFLRNIEETGARFGDRRYSPLDPALATSLSRRYEEDLERFGVMRAA